MFQIALQKEGGSMSVSLARNRLDNKIADPLTGANGSKSAWCLLVVLVVLLCVLAVPVFSALWRLWNADKNFTGLMLVPCMCGFILLRHRNNLAAIMPASVWRVLYILPVLLAGMVTLSLYGYIRLSALLFILNMLIISFGVLGPAAGKVLLGPLLFLALMVPPAQHCVDFLTVTLQNMFSFAMGLSLPLLTDRLAEHSGFTFWFVGMDYPMVIAPECSGIRSLLGLLVVSSFFITLDKHKLRAALILLIAGVTLALSLNLVRIMVTMQLRLNGLADYSLGAWHGNLGKVVFVLGYLVLSRLSRSLKRADWAGQEVEA